MNVLVTGGAGFIGSHLARELVSKGHSVKVLDNLSSGHKRNLNDLLSNQNIELIVGDCRIPSDVNEALKDIDVVFHFAANPEVRLELADPKKCFEQNIEATYILLEEIKKSSVECVVFASSSTVYGEATTIPTPEHYGPLKPISIYGASKLACEALVSSYCYSFGKRGVIIRPANIVGPGATHGVILDFIKKLMINPSELEILGDGRQTKSYLYVDDCVDAIIKAYESADEQVSIYNVGSDDQASVVEIAKIVIGEMGLTDVKLRLTSRVEGGRGWVGDVKNMLLEVNKLKSLGWKPKMDSREAIRQATRDLMKELGVR